MQPKLINNDFQNIDDGCVEKQENNENVAELMKKLEELTVENEEGFFQCY